jgi:hypothetical protein
MTVSGFANWVYCCKEKLEGRRGVDTLWIKCIEIWAVYLETQPCGPDNSGCRCRNPHQPRCKDLGVVTPQSPTILPSLQHTLIVESSSYQPTAYIMAAPEVHHLFHHPIADHSFSADKQTLAVARDTSVELYGRTGSGFKLKDELKGHDKLVTSVDIALSTGRIVTCSQGE